MVRAVVGVVFIVEVLEDVGGVVETSEVVVRERADSEVDSHGSPGVGKSLDDLTHVVGELDEISEDEGPGSADVGDLRVGDDVLVSRDPDLLTDGDADLGDTGDTSDESGESDIGEDLAARFRGVVDDDRGELVDGGVGGPVESSELEEAVIFGGVFPGTDDRAGGLCEFGDHVNSSDFLGADKASASVGDSVELLSVALVREGESDVPVEVEQEIKNGEKDIAEDGDDCVRKVVVLLERVEHGGSHVAVHAVLVLSHFWAHELSLGVAHLVGVSSDCHHVNVVSLIFDDVFFSVLDLLQEGWGDINDWLVIKLSLAGGVGVIGIDLPDESYHQDEQKTLFQH